MTWDHRGRSLVVLVRRYDVQQVIPLGTGVANLSWALSTADELNKRVYNI